MADVILEGLDEVEAYFQKLLKQLPAVSDDALAECAEDLLGKSTALAPYDEGTLRGSGEVKALGEGEYEVGFYGLPYAEVQHERLDFHHDVGQALFLEEPFVTNVHRYIQRVADAAKKEL